MHMQIRCHPRASAPDVAKLLGLLKDGNVDLLTIGGSDVEFGGELAIVPKEGQEGRAMEILLGAHYDAREVHVDDPESGLTLCEVDDAPGKLFDCLTGISLGNLNSGRIIRDLVVGPPSTESGHEGKVPVHIYSELVRTFANQGS